MIGSNGAYMALAPQAFSETSPQFYQSMFVPRLGLPLETAFASYGQIYRTQVWIAAAVNKIADSIARLPIHVWNETAKGKTLDKSSPYAQLMDDPCATMDRYHFWQWVAATFEVYGEAFLIKIREGRGDQITSLIPAHPSMMTIRRDEYGESEYRFLGRPNEVFSQRDVVPFRRFNPDGTMRGLSRLEALRSTLMMEDSSRRAIQAAYQNRLRPSMILRSNKDLGIDGRTRIANAFSSQHGGSGNTGRVMVLEAGEFEEPTIVGQSAVDMEYIASRQFSREEVEAGFDLPPTALQDNTKSTYANSVEHNRSLYRDGIMPRIEAFESVLKTHVGDEFFGPKKAKWDMRHVLRGDWEKRAGAHAQLVQSGIEEPAEAREDMDLPDAGQVSHQLFAQQQLQPLGTPPARPSLPAGHAPEMVGEAQPSALVAKYVRDISGHIGRGRTLQAAADMLIAKTGDTDGVREAFEYLLERRFDE